LFTRPFGSTLASLNTLGTAPATATAFHLFLFIFFVDFFAGSNSMR
jgi:hypothetical protein